MSPNICGNRRINTTFIDNPKEEKKMGEKQRSIMTLAMDGTAITDFRIVDNTKYSQEIIEGARAVRNLEILQELKDREDLAEFYAEGKKQILSQWHALQALTVHSDMFLVLLQIDIGHILNEIEPTFKNKGGYVIWVKENFEQRHSRYFQQAKQLADMGDFAKNYSAAGKNRLLALEHLRKVEKKRDCEALFADYPLPDTTADDDGHLLKRQIDAVVTLHRLKSAGIRFATFDQATNIASVDSEAITVKKAEEIKAWLDQQPAEERQGLFDRYVQDQMAYPSDHPYTSAPKASLNKILADLLQAYENADIDDESWIEQQQKVLDMDSLLSAQRFISHLIDRIRASEPATTASTETTAIAETQASA